MPISALHATTWQAGQRQSTCHADVCGPPEPERHVGLPPRDDVIASEVVRPRGPAPDAQLRAPTAGAMVPVAPLVCTKTRKLMVASTADSSQSNKRSKDGLSSGLKTVSWSSNQWQYDVLHVGSARHLHQQLHPHVCTVPAPDCQQ